MNIQEGPAFGALIIGVGFGFLLFQKTSNPGLSLGVGVLVALVDYFVLVWVARFKDRNK